MTKIAPAGAKIQLSGNQLRLPEAKSAKNPASLHCTQISKNTLGVAVSRERSQINRVIYISTISPLLLIPSWALLTKFDHYGKHSEAPSPRAQGAPLYVILLYILRYYCPLPIASFPANETCSLWQTQPAGLRSSRC